MTSTGFVGLGAIGLPMAKRLLGAEGGLVVHDLDAAQVARLERRGARRADSPRDLAAQTAHVSVMVRDDAQVRDAVLGGDGVLAGALPGTVIAVHSTISPATARELAAVAGECGVLFVDAPVSGGPMGAADGSLAVMVGGTDEAFAAARPTLEMLGSLVVHAGPIGSGTVMKLARNLLHFVAFAASGEALALAEAHDIDLATLGEVVRHTDAITGGPGAILLRGAHGELAADDPWRPVMRGVRDLGEKDLGLALDLAHQAGIAAPLAALAHDRLAAALGVPHPKGAR